MCAQGSWCLVVDLSVPEASRTTPKSVLLIHERVDCCGVDTLSVQNRPIVPAHKNHLQALHAGASTAAIYKSARRHMFTNLGCMIE